MGLPRGARDVWEELGSRAEARYTWDLTRNTNLEWAGKWKPRCRLVVVRPEADLHVLMLSVS